MSTTQSAPSMNLNTYPDIITQFTPNFNDEQTNGSPIRVAHIPHDVPKEDIGPVEFANIGVNAVVVTQEEAELMRQYRMRPQTRRRTFEPVILKKNNGPLVIHEKRWYFRLVQGKEGDYKRARALMDDFTLNEISHHMVVCFTPDRLPGTNRLFRNKEGKPIRIYAFFDSYLEFFEYMQKFNPTERAFYEIIFGELPQKPHFDIDISIDDLETLYPGEDFDTVAETLREAVIMGCINVLTDNHVVLDLQRDILLYSSHGEDKRSYHLVINNKCHDGNKEAKAFYDAVMGKIRIITQGKYLEFVDKSVYSPRQQFRLVGCQKQQSNRPKVFYEEFWYQGQKYTHIYNEDVTDLTMKKLTIIYESMSSFTSGCAFLPSLIPPKPINHNNLGEMPDLEGNIVEHCMGMLREKMAACSFTIIDRSGYEVLVRPTCPFSVKEVRGHLILLKRHSSSYCPICKKSIPHENEHPYMFIVHGKVYWDCRRSDQYAPGAPKLFVGYLAMSIEELQTGIVLPGTIPDEEVELDEGGEFMFGDYNIGAPTLPPLKPITTPTTVDNNRKSPPIIALPQAQPIADTGVPTIIIPINNMPPEQRRQNVQGLTMKIAQDWARKKYIRSEAEDLTGVRSLSTVSTQLPWTTGLNK